ncbi:fimbrillin family protein [Parabacteroides chinchillae]
MKKLLLFMILAIGIFSCSEDNNLIPADRLGSKEKPLNIYTTVLTTKAPYLIQEFKDNTVIGLHVTDGNVNNVYRKMTDYKNVKAVANMENNKLFWRQDPEIFLNKEETTVYAYYPYMSQSNFDATRIPVKICPDASQTDDYMYGTHATGQKAVNSVSPIAMLTMNHALSLISFEVKLNKKTDYYLLSAIQLGNKAGGTSFYSEGTMDIVSGKITGSAGINASTRLTLACPTELTTTFSSPVQLMVIPTSETILKGDIEALFIINNKTYKYQIPTETKWKKGYKYLYQMIFDGKSIVLDKISNDNWIPGK